MRNANIITQNLTLAETIAHRNPEVANELLIRNGYPHSANRDVLARNLNQFILKHRESALKQLAGIHPDKEIISNFAGDDNADGDENMPPVRSRRRVCPGCGKKHSNVDGFDNCCGSSGADGYSNCAGCGGACGAKMHFNAAGDSQKQSTMNQAALVNKEMLAIVGVIALATIALIAISRPQKS